MESEVIPFFILRGKLLRRVNTGMGIFGYLSYVFIYLRIGICYPCYRDLRIKIHIPACAVFLMTSGILLLCLARSVSFRVYACVPPLLLCAWTDFERNEIPDLCHIVPIALSLMSHSARFTEAFLMFLILIPFVHTEKLGAGDLKLLAAYTLLLGEDIVFAVLTACLTALILHRKRPDAEVFAFGPYLSSGIFLILFLLR